MSGASKPLRHPTAVPAPPHLAHPAVGRESRGAPPRTRLPSNLLRSGRRGSSGHSQATAGRAGCQSPASLQSCGNTAKDPRALPLPNASQASSHVLSPRHQAPKRYSYSHGSTTPRPVPCWHPTPVHPQTGLAVVTSSQSRESNGCYFHGSISVTFLTRPGGDSDQAFAGWVADAPAPQLPWALRFFLQCRTSCVLGQRCSAQLHPQPVSSSEVISFHQPFRFSVSRPALPGPFPAVPIHGLSLPGISKVLPSFLVRVLSFSDPCSTLCRRHTSHLALLRGITLHFS